MRVTVFGADNEIGGKVVDELIWRGYEAMVFVSDPSTVPSTWGHRVQVVGEQLTDSVAVATALERTEAVVNTLDPRLDGGPGAHLLEGTAHMVTAMQHHGVRRYVGLGSPAVGLCPKEQPTPVVKAHRVLLRALRPRVHGQMRQMMATVTGAELDWTIVRFLRHTPGRGRGAEVRRLLRPRRHRIFCGRRRHRCLRRHPAPRCPPHHRRPGCEQLSRAEPRRPSTTGLPLYQRRTTAPMLSCPAPDTGPGPCWGIFAGEGRTRGVGKVSSSESSWVRSQKAAREPDGPPRDGVEVPGVAGFAGACGVGRFRSSLGEISWVDLVFP